jgi:hypothetical protein
MSKSGKVGKYEVEDGVVDGTAGNDLIFPHFVDVDGDTVDGADGLDDIIYGYAGNDNIQGGAGNDVIYGDSDASREIPAAGKAGKAGKYDDLVDGNDTLNGGAGSDIIYGGGGDDLILVDGIGEGYDDFVDGGTFETTLVASGKAGKAGKAGELTDNDTLNITGSTDGETVFARLDNLRPDSDGNGQDGTVTWLDADGNVLGSMDFENIENIVGDFTPRPENNDPEAENDTAFVDEDGEVTINVLGNDTDPDGDDLTVTDATSPDGEVTINADGTITFTPDENFNGTTTITYTVDDGNGGTDTATVDVTVNAVDELEAVDDTAETDEDTPVTIDVVANDLNVDGGEPTIISATVPADQGTVEIVGNELVFTPAENFNGDATITYTIEDEDGLQDTAEVAVTVTPVNDAPDAVNDVDTTDEDTPVTVDLLANDTDVDGDTLTVTGATVPAEQGTLVDNGDGTVTFTPAENFNGTATISYSIEDGNGGTDTAIHEIDVTPVNDDPVAVDDAADTMEEEPVVVDLIGNDTDVDGDPLTIGTVTVPADQGTVVDNGDGTVTFTPAENFTGPATITYTVVDGQGGEDEGEAIVNVGNVVDAPDAVDDEDTTDEDTAVTVDLLANDTDPEGQALTVTGASVPADQGTLVDNGDGTVTFTPAPNFNGEATISYSIVDTEGGTDSAIHTITVTPVNDDPVAVDDLETTDEDVPVTIDLIGNDTDVDGDPLTIGTVTVPADQGTVVDNGDGTVTFTPAPNFNGPATITYTVVDGQGGEDEGEAVVSVGAVNDGPVANTDTDTTDEDTPVTVDLLANDTDDDGDDLTVISATVPAEQGTLVDNGDGTVTFTPAPDFNGEATISYEISDGNGGTDTSTHVITVTPQDDAPEAVDDLAETDEDTPVTIDVLDNDSDPDGDPLEVSDATSPDGTVDINPDGTITFTPNENFNGEATITYTVENPDGNEDTATVTVTVNPVNDAPDAVDDEDVTDFNTPVTVDLLANDTDVDGDDLSVLIATVPADQGTLVDNGDGTVTFTPALGFVGAATISYTIEDEEGLTDSAVHVITVAAGELDGTVEGTAGDDLIDGDYLGDPDGDMVDNNDAILPGDVGDDDLIYGFGGDDSILAGAGDDEVYGGDGNDTIVAAAGDDTVYGGDGDDSLEGGSGDDTIIGGTGEDEQYGGLGNDTFLGGNGGDVVVGGEDPDLDGDGESDDVDVLDLTGSGVANIDYVAGDPEAGTVTFLDGSTMTFSEIENVIPCFTPGTTIATPKGERLVEELREGDRIITRDNGIQEIRWVGRKEMSGKSLVANPHLKPILIRAGSLGNGLPERDMLVSPNHRMLVASEKTQLYFEEHEVLAAAKHLVGSEGIHAVDVMGTAYIHFMFDRHEVVRSNGAWTESFQPGDYSLKGIGNSQRNEIFELFPELQEKQGLEGYQSARRALKKHEAKLLVR